MIPWITGWALSVLTSGVISPTAEPTSLAEVREFPSSWTDREVRFVVQFDTTLPTWDPLFTRFGPRDWVAFSAWADERFTWDPSVYAHPFPRLFVPRDSRLALRLEGAERFARFDVQAVCREVFGGEPWFEIQHLVPLETSVGEGTLVTVHRAREALKLGRFEIALELLERAKLGPLPEHALAGLDRLVRSVQASRLAWNERRTAADPARGRVRR